VCSFILKRHKNMCNNSKNVETQKLLTCYNNK
jgi:hypothetical protein